MIYIHGTDFDCCEICDTLLTPDKPGRRWTYKWQGRIYEVHVCNDCFNDAEYQALVKNHEGIRVETYPLT